MNTLLRLLPVPLIALALACSAAESVKLNLGGGVYSVPVRINDQITLAFILDTGASDVIVPLDVAMTLARAGTIAESDILGNRQYQIADGTLVPHTLIRFRTLRIGHKIISNVTAGVGDLDAQMLLGQSALQKLEPWRLDSAGGALVLMDEPSTPLAGKPQQLSHQAAMEKRHSGPHGTAPNAPADSTPFTAYLSGWVAGDNAAHVGRDQVSGQHSLPGLISVTFPLTGVGADLAACDAESSINEHRSAYLRIIVDGSVVAKGPATAAQGRASCWIFALPSDALGAIKHGATMAVAIDNSLLIGADLTGSARAINAAWEYVAAELLKQ